MYIFFKVENGIDCVHFSDLENSKDFLLQQEFAVSIEDNEFDALGVDASLLSVDFNKNTVFVNNDAVKAKELEIDVAKALEYLAETDFYFTIDKYATLSDERKAELAKKRADARATVNLQN